MNLTKRWMRPILASSFLLLAAPGGLRRDAAAHSLRALDAELRFDTEIFSLHEPIVAALRIRNRSKGPVKFDLGLNFRGDLVLAVTQPDGRRIVRRLPEDFDGFGAIGRVALDPNQVYQERLVLNDWHTFDQVGDYKVEMELPSVQEAAAMRTEQLTLSGHFRVKQRDPAQLLTTCKRLEEVALGNEPDATRDAAHALSFATDEICLPSLHNVLKARYLGRDDIIRALAKMGTEAAIGAVVDAWDVLDKHSQESALREFNYVAGTTTLREALRKSGKRVTER